MRSRFADTAEGILGGMGWGASYAWGALIGAMLLLAPLLLANLIAEIWDAAPASVAIGAGVAGAYAIGFGPWESGERASLLFTLGGAVASVVACQFIRGSADAGPRSSHSSWRSQGGASGEPFRRLASIDGVADGIRLGWGAWEAGRSGAPSRSG